MTDVGIYFNKRAKIFDRCDWVSDQYLLNLIKSLIETNVGKKLLDLGIGTGIVETKLKSEINITGIDSSVKMIEMSRQRLPKARLINGDINNLNDLLKNEKFDIVFSRATLGHMKIKPVIKKAIKFLNPSGKIILCESASFLPEDEINQLNFANLIHPGHVEFPTPERFLKMFKEVGLKVKYSKMVTTNCSLNKLIETLSSEVKVAKLKKFLGKSLPLEWDIIHHSGDIFFRRLWILLVAEYEN